MSLLACLIQAVHFSFFEIEHVACDFEASRSIAHHCRPSQASPQKSQQCGQSAILTLECFYKRGPHTAIPQNHMRRPAIEVFPYNKNSL